MSLSLLAPAALAALAAVLVPLLVHLMRRSEHLTVVFAAMRWLTTHVRPRRRLRFEEIGLLASRIGMIVLIAPLLAQPLLTGGRLPEHWVLVSTSVPAAARSELPQGDAVQLRWLAPGFPLLTEPMPPGPQPTASLLREADALLGPQDTLTALVPAVLHGLDGAALRLSRRVDWQVAPAGGETESATDAAPPPRALAVRLDADSAAAARYLRAAVAAWNPPAVAEPSPYTLDLAEADTAPSAAQQWLVWLRAGPLPGTVLDWIRAGGVALVAVDVEFATAAAAVVWRGDDGTPLAQAQALGNGRVIQFARPFAPAQMPALLEPDFPARLLALFDGPPTAPTLAPAAVHLPQTDAAPWPERGRPLDQWIVVALLAVFALERWLASARTRGVKP